MEVTQPLIDQGEQANDPILIEDANELKKIKEIDSNLFNYDPNFNQKINGTSDLTELIISKDLNLVLYKEGKITIKCLIHESKSFCEVKPTDDLDETIKTFLVIPEPPTLIVALSQVLVTYHINTSPLSLSEIERKSFSGHFISALYYSLKQKSVYCSFNKGPLHVFKFGMQGKLEETRKIESIVNKNFKKILIYEEFLIWTDQFGGLHFFNLDERRNADNSHIDFLQHKVQINLIEISKFKPKMLTSSAENGIRVWNLNPPSLDTQLIGHDVDVTALCVTNNGDKAISGDKAFKVIIWDLSQNTDLQKIQLHTDYINQILVTDDDKYFFTCSVDKKIKIGELSMNSSSAELRGHKDAVNKIGLINYTIYSVSKDKTLRIWTLPPHEESEKIDIPDSGINFENLIFTSEKYITAVSYDSFKIYSPGDNGKYELKCHNEEILNHRTIKTCKFSNNSDRVFCIFTDSGEIERAKLEVENLNALEFVNILGDKPENNVVFEVLPDNRILTINSMGTVELWTDDITADQAANDPATANLLIQNIECYDYQVFPDYSVSFAIALINTEIDILKVVPTVELKRNVLKIDQATSISKAISTILQLNNNYLVLTYVDDFAIYVHEIPNDTPITVTTSPDPQSLILPQSIKVEGHRKMIKTIIKKKIDDTEFLITASEDLTIRAWSIIYENQSDGTPSSKISEVFESFALQEHNYSITSLVDIPNTDFVATGSLDKTVVVWNIFEKRIESKYMDHTYPVKHIAIVGNRASAKLILSQSERSIHLWDFSAKERKDNPVSVNGVHDSVEKFIVLNKLKYKVAFSENQRFLSFSDCNLSYLHFLAYWGRYNLLDIALKQNFPVVTSHQGKNAATSRGLMKSTIGKEQLITDFSPLFYALKTKSMACVKVFIDRLTFLSTTNLNLLRCFCHAIRNDVNELLKSSTNVLFNFFECIFIATGPPKIENNYISVPNIAFENSYILKEHDFVNADVVQTEEILVEYRSCIIELPMKLGSKISIEFLRALEECKINQIFRSKLIGNIIDYKWDRVKVPIVIHAVIFWIRLVLIAVIAAGVENFEINIFFIVLNSLLFLYEFLQIITSGIDYFKDYWNYLDLFSLLFNSIWIASIMITDSGFDVLGDSVGWAVVFFSFMRGITCFRIMDSTRYYIQLVIRSIEDTFSFMIIYFYTTFAFGVMFKASGYTDKDNENKPFSIFSYYWQLSYNENIGGLDSDTSNWLFYISFMLASILNVTMMLNLLISILGDTFDKFQVEAAEVDKKEKLEGILEIESVMSLFSPTNEKCFIHMCIQCEFDENEAEWEGRIRALEKKIEEVGRKLEGESVKLSGEIKKVGIESQEGIRNIYKKIDNMQNSLMSFISEHMKRTQNK